MTSHAISSTLRLSLSEAATAARGWDDQHLFLAGGADSLAALDAVSDPASAIFTEGARAPAARFASRWRDEVRALGRRAESAADGVREAARAVVGADGDGGAACTRATTDLERLLRPALCPVLLEETR